MFIQSFLFLRLDYAKNSRFYLNWVILKKGWETLNFVKFFSISWLGSIPFDLFVFVWPIVAIEHLFRQDSLMFMHCSHVSFTGAHQVFDKMPNCFGLQWVPNFGDYHDWTCLSCFDHWVCVLHTLTQMCLVIPCTCIAYAHHMHAWCTHLLTCHVFAFQSC